MRSGMRWLVAGGACVAMAAGGGLAQSVTTTYTYDALGRMTKSIVTGGSEDGHGQVLCYDAAGNRSCLNQFTTPPPVNSPPVAVLDNITVTCGLGRVANLTANDSDPEGNLPLKLTSVTITSGLAQITSFSASGDVNVIGGLLNGISYGEYSVEDSLGATSTGQIRINTTGSAGACGNP